MNTHNIPSAMSSSTQQTTKTTMSMSAAPAKSKEVIMHDAVAQEPVANDAWKRFQATKHTVPFLAVPPEIHLKIFSFLNPIDSVCLSLVNKYIYSNSPRITPESHPLTIGAPGSSFPVEKIEGCKHCVPVLYFPAHCELHYHLRGFIPKEFNYCGGQCGKYTKCEQKGYSDSEEYCGTCGVSYWRRYERGRRMLDMLRPGEKQERLCKWYNDPKL